MGDYSLVDQTLQNFHEQLLNWTIATHPSLENSSNLTAYLLHSHATAAYDAVWSLAVAWNMTTPRLVFEEGICNMTNLLQVATTTASVLSESLHATRLGGIAVSDYIVIISSPAVGIFASQPAVWEGPRRCACPGSRWP